MEWGPAKKEHRREWFLANNYEIARGSSSLLYMASNLFNLILVAEIATAKTLTAEEKYHNKFVALCSTELLPSSQS